MMHIRGLHEGSVRSAEVASSCGRVSIYATRCQYVKFAIMLLMFVDILIGSYWFVMVPSGTNGGREDPSDTDAEEGAHREA